LRISFDNTVLFSAG
jgi:hypothetical protein